tara:strand:+ start:25742 stop:26083 length:342 start_codon:yes stop_codon:yes gene_type:complete
MIQLVILLVLTVVLLAIYAAALVTYYTVISEYFETGQKFVIVAIAWFVPILGPVSILYILSKDQLIERKRGIPWLNYLFVADFLAGAESRPQSETPEQFDAHNDGSDIGDIDT